MVFSLYMSEAERKRMVCCISCVFSCKPVDIAVIHACVLITIR